MLVIRCVRKLSHDCPFNTSEVVNLGPDDTLAEAHTSLGEIEEVFELDFQSAEP
jgi:hypothetical protein